MSTSHRHVIVGGGSGMGRAVASRLASEGALLLADRSEAGLEAVKAELGDGADVKCMVVDITNADDVARLAGAACRGFRSLVVTAGLSGHMGSGRDIMNVNLVGMARVLDAFGPLASEGSVAVCFASIAGHMLADRSVLPLLDDALRPDLLDRITEVAPEVLDDPDYSYSASKAAVIQLAKRTGVAWGASGARCVSLSPGIIDTPMGALEMENQPIMPQMIKQTPLRRQGRPEEVAEVVHFLCSPLASYMTACDILVDGGFQGWTETMAAHSAGAA